MDLARKAGRLLLFIDDINRTPDAARLLHLAINVAAPMSGDAGQATGGGTPAPAESLCQVVPVWQEHMSTLPPKVLDQSWLRTVDAGQLLPDEAVQMIRGKVRNMSPLKAGEYAARLNHDPFLVGLFTILADQNMDARQLGAVADDAIGRFLETNFKSICSAVAVDLLPAELRKVLGEMARQMLLRRNLQPSWEELDGWFGDGSITMRGMRALVHQEHVCRLDSEQRLVFRHDRLREWLLVHAMGDLLQLPEPPEDIVTDPYFSVIVGKTLARTDLPQERLVFIRMQAPWALFEAVREVAEPSSRHQSRVFEEARIWASSYSQSVPDSVLTAICWALVETDSKHVLPIIDAMKPNFLLMIAGLRNGSVEHGMRYVRARIGAHIFEPGGGDKFRDRIIEHARNRHGQKISRQLHEQLSRADLSVLDGNSYLALLGHFGFDGFDDLIARVWERQKDETLAYAIWAAARCPLQDLSKVLNPLIEMLLGLPVRENRTNIPSDREMMTLYLSWSFGNGIASGALERLLEVGRRDNASRADVSLLVERIDHPDASEFLVRHLAEGGTSNRWMHLTGIGDGDPAFEPRSPETNDRLRNLWESIDVPKEVRIRAFCLWLRTHGCKDATLLAKIDCSSPFYEFAVQHRVKLRDYSVVPGLVQLLRSDKWGAWWWLLAHRVWCIELRSLANETLGSFKDKIPKDFSGGRTDDLFSLAELLGKISVADGETLLRQHWDYLRYSPLMIGAAFRIGTPGCVALANEALFLCPQDVQIFNSVFAHAWGQANSANPIKVRHLENLEVHLDRMSCDEILYLAWHIEQAGDSDEGIADWIHMHLVPRLAPEKRTRIRVADEFFLANLDRWFQQTDAAPYLGFLFEERGGYRLVFPERQLRLLDVWLSAHRTVRGLEVAAECLKHIGTRRDLDLLNRYPIDGEVSAIERILSDVRFSIRKRVLV